MKTFKFYFLSIVLICGWSITSRAQTSTVTGKVTTTMTFLQSAPHTSNTSGVKVCPVGKPVTACVLTNDNGDYSLQIDASVTKLTFKIDTNDCNESNSGPHELDIPANKTLNYTFNFTNCP